jgi:short-subunit dehydrogenase
MRSPGTVLITGASSGIGLELARIFAARGHPLVIVSRDATRLRAAADELRTGGASVTALGADLEQPGDVERLIGEIRSRGIEVEMLVNNAGFGAAGRFDAVDPSQLLGMIALNAAAPTRLMREFLGDMRARRSGRVMNVASTAAFQPGPYMAVYYATKAFLLSLSDAVAEESSGTGVTVTTLCPGPTRTSFTARAQLRGSRLFRAGATMDAAAVARAGYVGFMRGDRLVVPGIVNKLSAQAYRFFPRRLVVAATRFLNSGRAER